MDFDSSESETMMIWRDVKIVSGRLCATLVIVVAVEGKCVASLFDASQSNLAILGERERKVFTLPIHTK